MRTLLRWLFAALVLVNVGVAMWARWYRKPTMPPPAQPLPQVHPERMVLLSLPPIKPSVPAPAAPAKTRSSHPSAPSLGKASGPAIHAASNIVAVPAPVRRCVTIGPFSAAEAAQRGGAWLKGARISYAVRTQDDQVPASYWVYLPPLASRAAAERMLKELDRKGVRQHIIVRQPGLENAISLGLYDMPANASTRITELARKGVHAQQQIRYRLLTRYWLDVELARPGERAQLLGQDWGVAGAAVQDVPCAGAPSSSARSASPVAPRSGHVRQVPVADRGAPVRPASSP